MGVSVDNDVEVRDGLCVGGGVKVRDGLGDGDAVTVGNGLDVTVAGMVDERVSVGLGVDDVFEVGAVVATAAGAQAEAVHTRTAMEIRTVASVFTCLCTIPTTPTAYPSF